MFEERNDTVNCIELMGVDLGSAEGFKKAREQGLFHSKCEKYIRDTCEFLESIM